MSNQSLTPYQNLTPDLMLDAIESLGYCCDGRFLALNSYENRVYQIGIENQPYIIAKFYRPNRLTKEAILEEHEFALDLAQEEIPVVAPIVDKQGNSLHLYEGFYFAVFPCRGGRVIELDNLDHLEWMGRFVGRLHAFGQLKSFQHRRELTVTTYGDEPYQYLLDNNIMPLTLQKNLSLILEKLLENITLRFNAVGDIKKIRLHGDLHAGNILWHDDMPHIVDLDDCLMGPAIQDLWMFLSGDKAQQNLQLDILLEGYNEFFHFNHQELQLIESLRSLRMIHYNAWLAKRYDDPAFPRAFPWFNTERYWQQQLEDFQEQLSLFE